MSRHNIIYCRIYTQLPSTYYNIYAAIYTIPYTTHNMYTTIYIHVHAIHHYYRICTPAYTQLLSLWSAPPEPPADVSPATQSTPITAIVVPTTAKTINIRLGYIHFTNNRS